MNTPDHFLIILLNNFELFVKTKDLNKQRIRRFDCLTFYFILFLGWVKCYTPEPEKNMQIIIIIKRN